MTIRKLHQDLRKANSHLEKKVAERTDELLNKNIHLEKEIEKRIIVEAELKKSQDELEQRVIERTEELNQSLETLKEAQNQLIKTERLAALGNMVTGVAHEINTPIGIGVTVASHLKDQADSLYDRFVDGSITKKGFERFLTDAQISSDSIVTNLERTAGLIERFKQVAADHNDDHKQLFSIKKCIEAEAANVQFRYTDTKSNLLITCPADLKLNSYQEAFRTIINNLFHNSITHGFIDNNNNEIFIDITIKEDVLVFKFRDSGVGVDEKISKQIFDPFFTTRRNLGNYGLGLTIVYNLVTQKLQGEISCHSSKGKGLEITMIFPEKYLLSNH